MRVIQPVTTTSTVVAVASPAAVETVTTPAKTTTVVAAAVRSFLLLLLLSPHVHDPLQPVTASTQKVLAVQATSSAASLKPFFFSYF